MKKSIRKRQRNTILVVVDGSAASRRALAYVATIVRGRRGFSLCLTTVLPPFPPRLLESRGTEDPEGEEELNAQLKVKQRRWISTMERTAQRTLVNAVALLRDARIKAGAVETPAGSRDAADAILDLARDRKCGTVVVGRESVSWFRQLFRSDLAEELVRRATGFTIWVVE
jgi:nucleotide-binding universal stress UspA family protein